MCYDLHRSSEMLSFILFADDTNIFYSHENKKTLNDILVNTELVKVSSWLQANKLSLNIKETWIIIFKVKNKKLNETVEIKLNNEKIKQVELIKLLGINIDSNLTWIQNNIQTLTTLQKITRSYNRRTQARGARKLICPQFVHNLSRIGKENYL